jgi:hypothetical protein
MKTLSRLLPVCCAFVLGLGALIRPALADGGGYGYFRVVEGSAELAQAGTDERDPIEVNQPVLAGDHLWTASGRSKVEVVLADQNILRVDGNSELVFERLAASADRDDRATVVRLLSGNAQLIVTPDALGDELPRIETPNASIYPQDYGTYRITSDEGWTQLVVRRGSAQMVTDAGSSRVRADEEAVVDDHAPDRRAEVREAGAFDSLERWGRQLDDEYASVDLGSDVDDNLRYQAAPLTRYGAWVTLNGARYWRPRVDAEWRPYWHGRWIYTPAGLTWISSEPWGWVPYHYGTWDYVPGYGWVWQPGYVWSPAWVYWYWGPSYVGWCPTGYYTRYYGPELGVDIGFRFGVYGWAGGSWSLFDRWSFVSTSYFSYAQGYRQGYRDGYWDAHRDVRRYAVPIDRDARHAIERGIITTDTRPLKPSVWKDPGEPLRVLRGRAAELPDVTPFVARTPKPKLPPAVARAVVAEKPQGLDGTPLRPATLGRPDRRPPGERTSIFGAKPGQSGRPAAGKPAVREPQVRPGAQADGGAPNPRTGRDRGKPAVVQPPGQPSVGRPAPEAAGGAPKPDRPSVFGNPPDRSSKPPATGKPPASRDKDRDRSVNPPPVRPSVVEPRTERKPGVESKPAPRERPEAREEKQRPPERKPEVQERRPPEPKPQVQEKRQPERKQDDDKDKRKPPRR